MLLRCPQNPRDKLKMELDARDETQEMMKETELGSLKTTFE